MDSRRRLRVRDCRSPSPDSRCRSRPLCVKIVVAYASLYKDRVLSLGTAAQISGLSLSEFIDHLTQLDIDVVVADKQTAKELETLDSWLSS